jgi:hypothetical protein
MSLVFTSLEPCGGFEVWASVCAVACVEEAGRAYVRELSGCDSSTTSLEAVGHRAMYTCIIHR